MATFNVQGKVVLEDTGLGVSFATVKVYQLGQTAPLVADTTDLEGNFSMSFAWAKDVSVHSNRPDVHFKITQMMDGAETEIYNEDPAKETRHNIADILAVTLEVKAGLSAVPTTSGRPYDWLFLFTRVGITGVDQIDTVGASPSGYAHPDTSSSVPNSKSANSPFGRTLDLAAWFGQYTDIYRYKVQYSTDGITWNDVSDPLANRYYEFAIGGGNWATMAMGPFSEGGQNNVYKLPYIERPGQPWIFPDLIARWDTSKVANGLYTLRVLGFKPDTTGTALVPATVLIVDPSYGELNLRVDNSPPEVELKKIRYATNAGDPWTEAQVCEIIDLADGKIEIEFEARDVAGHLRSYALNAMFGHNQAVGPRPVTPDKAADDYSHHIGPSRHWQGGGSLKTVYDASGPSPHDYTSTRMPSCAYQFRLGVSKRTTNGYGLIYHGVEDTKHLTIRRLP